MKMRMNGSLKSCSNSNLSYLTKNLTKNLMKNYSNSSENWMNSRMLSHTPYPKWLCNRPG